MRPGAPSPLLFAPHSAGRPALCAPRGERPRTLSMVLASDKIGLQSQFCRLVAVWLWANHRVSLGIFGPQVPPMYVGIGRPSLPSDEEGSQRPHSCTELRNVFPPMLAASTGLSRYYVTLTHSRLTRYYVTLFIIIVSKVHSQHSQCPGQIKLVVNVSWAHSL